MNIDIIEKLNKIKNENNQQVVLEAIEEIKKLRNIILEKQIDSRFMKKFTTIR